MNKKILGIVTGVVLALSLALNVFLFQKTRLSFSPNQVQKVIDGDTLILTNGQRVRLLSIAAPEMGLCGSEQAKKRLEELVLDKNIRLEDKVIDKYSRVVALVYADQILVNEVLLREGWARNDAAGNSKKEDLKQAHGLALKEKIGIFSSLCRLEKTDKPGCLIKGNLNHDDKKFYHFPGCHDYNQTIVEKDKGDDWFCSEAEAQKAGFQKSQNCYGKKYSL